MLSSHVTPRVVEVHRPLAQPERQSPYVKHLPMVEVIAPGQRTLVAASLMVLPDPSRRLL